MPSLILAELVEKNQLTSDIFKFSMRAPEIIKTAKPGNFVEIRVSNQTEPFLRRPISIHNMDRDKGILEVIFQVKGKGTQILATKQVGDKIDVIGPLGYGTFKYENYSNLAIIGGGIGVFPLYELAKCSKKDGKEVYTYLGFRNKDMVVLEEEFRQVSNRLVLTTDDGSYAEKGFAIDFLKKDIESKKVDSIYACGPIPMLKAVRKLAEEKDVPCQVSLEEKMACGLGVCLGCAVKKKGSPEQSPEYWHVCKAGPVFDSKLVEF